MLPVIVNIVEDDGLSGILLDRCYAVKKYLILKSCKIKIYFIPVQSQRFDWLLSPYQDFKKTVVSAYIVFKTLDIYKYM